MCHARGQYAHDWFVNAMPPHPFSDLSKTAAHAGVCAAPQAADPSDEELIAWLRLSMTAGVGNATIARLLAHCGSAPAIFECSTAELRDVATAAQLVKLRQVPQGLDAALARTRAWLEQGRQAAACDPSAVVHAVIALGDVRYPAALLQMSDPPLMLYAVGAAHRVLGTAPLVQLGQCLSIVGSRSPSVQGVDNARAFARELARMGFCVVSGLASGIDAAAHTGALDGAEDAPQLQTPDRSKGCFEPGCPPLTMAVIGTGADRVYPAAHRALSHRIAQHGIILSEFALGAPPKPANFPKRNRIISALSCGTLVVEAALASGSLITARLAAEQGREVFAIPGSIHWPLSRGPHALIRQGAKLVESVQDICEELAAAHPLGPAAAMENAGFAAAARGVKGGAKTQVKTAEKINKKSSVPVEISANPLLSVSTGLFDVQNNLKPTAEENPILNALGQDIVSLDTLAQRTGLDAGSLQAQLLELEIEGFIATQPGGLFCRVQQN